MLDKAIVSGKEKRKPYRRAKAVDTSCRNHKGCPWCTGNRTFFDYKRRSAAAQDLREFRIMEA